MCVTTSQQHTQSHTHQNARRHTHTRARAHTHTHTMLHACMHLYTPCVLMRNPSTDRLPSELPRPCDMLRRCARRSGVSDRAAKEPFRPPTKLGRSMSREKRPTDSGSPSPMRAGSSRFSPGELLGRRAISELLREWVLMRKGRSGSSLERAASWLVGLARSSISSLRRPTKSSR